MSGVALVLLDTLLYVSALVPETDRIGHLAVLPATLLLTSGTILVRRDPDGNVV